MNAPSGPGPKEPGTSEKLPCWRSARRRARVCGPLSRPSQGALAALGRFYPEQTRLDRSAGRRRAGAGEDEERIAFLDSESVIPRTGIRVRDAREGRFSGPGDPRDLRRQWIQGTGPAARPNAPAEAGPETWPTRCCRGRRWMFDGEDALGKSGRCQLDNLRNLKLALARGPRVSGSPQGRGRDERLGAGFFGRAISRTGGRNWSHTQMFPPRVRGLHLDDPTCSWDANGAGFSASIVDAASTWSTLTRALRAGRRVPVVL